MGMINSIHHIVIPFIVGIGLGAVNYAALWMTVQKITCARNPALLNVLSYAVRMGFIMAIFYIVMGGRWERLVICLAGFLLIRTISIKCVLPEKKTGDTIKKTV